MNIKLIHKHGPIYKKSKWKDTKDPCPVFDGVNWHIFGSGGSVIDERWEILHAMSTDVLGPWEETENPCKLEGVKGDHVAAPGVIFDNIDKIFHMFVQTDFLAVEGKVEHLVSKDGENFMLNDTALLSLPGTEEAGIYDPHPAIVAGEKYIIYSGTPKVLAFHNFFISQPDIFLAKSQNNSWDGPWKRLGKILDHSDISSHHNQRDDKEYEWGIEGPQLIELPDKKILLNATCFLPERSFGTRQRTFFAIGEKATGPFVSLGPVIHTQLQDWELGENGHAAGIICDNNLVLFYQARSIRGSLDVHKNDWRYGIAIFNINNII